MKDLMRFVVYVGVFAVPFIPLIIANSMFFPFITGKNFSFRIIVEIIFAAWIILALFDAQYRPKFSWILGGFGALVVIMFFANLFSEYQLKSFWSNFERMDGYVTLAHVFLYFLVVGSVLTSKKLWDRFLNTTLFAASLVAIYAFAQLGGAITINQGGVRLDGTLGNSAYMAIYMLFHIFIAALMFVRTESKNTKYVYGGLILVFIYLLIQTATRGTVLGLVGGGIVSAVYITISARNVPQVRTYGIGVMVAIIVIVGSFIAVKDQAFIAENRILKRIASVSLETGEARFIIWGMAFEGVKERPLLGWGQGNFNYVFNKYYKPELYGEEPWFDRVHNIVLDWLIAGGFLGAIAYFSIFFAAIYYLFYVPLFKEDKRFSVLERGVLLGLLAAYLFHNLFVFDNIVSYIYFGAILAFIHSRVGTEIGSIVKYQIDKRVVQQVAAPLVIVAVVGAVYFVNVPGILAAQDIINAFKSQVPEEILENFETALNRNSFGNQEIREQMTRQAQAIFRNNNLNANFKQKFLDRTEEELLKQADEKPGDARVHVFISSFYRSANKLDEAIEQLEIARSLSPAKQQIIYEQGLTQLQLENVDEALTFFKEAYELEPASSDSRIFYAIGAAYVGQPEIIDEVIDTDQLRLKFAQNDMAVQAVHSNGYGDLLKDMFKLRIQERPNDAQLRVNLAVLYYEDGNIDEAIAIIEQAGNDIPAFKAQADGFVSELKAGRVPGQPAPQVEVQSEQEVEVVGPQQAP